MDDKAFKKYQIRRARRMKQRGFNMDDMENENYKFEDDEKNLKRESEKNFAKNRRK